MYRFLFFVATLVLPPIFGWWFFFPVVFLYVYLAKLPYELLFAAVVLDTLFYMGESFVLRHIFLIFSLAIMLIAVLVDRSVNWQKVI